VLAMMEAGLMDRVEALRFFGNMSEQDAAARLAAMDAMSKAPPPREEGTKEVAEAAPVAEVSDAHAEAMDEVAEELDAAEEALGALELDEANAAVIAAVIESLREARGYLGLGPKVEAEVEIHEEEDDGEGE